MIQSKVTIAVEVVRVGEILGGEGNEAMGMTKQAYPVCPFLL